MNSKYIPQHIKSYARLLPDQTPPMQTSQSRGGVIEMYDK